MLNRLYFFKNLQMDGIVQGKYIVWIISGVIVGMGALAFFIKSGAQGKISPLIMANVINPYKELIITRDYENAYKIYASSDYKSKYTYAQFRMAQDSNRIEYGELLDIKPVSGLFLKETTSENRVIFKATFGYIGSKKQQRIIIDIIKENGVFKIYRTYNSYVSIGGLLPVIY